MGTVRLRFIDYGGYTWTQPDKDKVEASFSRIKATCQTLLTKVNAEIARLGREESRCVTWKMVKELEYLLRVVNAVVAGLNSGTQIDMYRYALPAGQETEGPRGRSKRSILGDWIAVDSGISLDRVDSLFFHELCHFFGDTPYEPKAMGIMHNTDNLEGVYDEAKSPGIGGSYLGTLLAARRSCADYKEVAKPDPDSPGEFIYERVYDTSLDKCDACRPNRKILRAIGNAWLIGPH